MRIILGGGGGADDERPLNVLLYRWIGPDSKLLYWPLALRGIRTFESCFEWITSSLSPLGIKDITMWTELARHRENDLDEFDGVYIGGGNTFSLLAELRESGFDQYLKSYAGRGKPVYGGSAGAVILGRDIRIVEHFDSNNVDLLDTTALDLARGHVVWPHYEPQHDDLIRSYIEEFNFSILAISERSGIVIDGNKVRGAGFEPAFLFDALGRHEVG